MSVAPRTGAELARLEKAYRDEPEEYADRLALLYLKEGRAKDAIQTIENLGAPTTADRFVLLAQGYFDDFDNAKAARLLDQAATAGTLERNPRAQLLLGELAFESGRSEDARRHLRAVITSERDHPRAAQLLRNLGEDIEVPESDAQDTLVGFQTEDPDRETPQRALLHVGLGFLVLAAVFAVYLWNANRAHEAKALAFEAMSFLAAGDYPALVKATEIFEQSLAVVPDNAFALSGAAEAQALLWADHGDASAMPKAKDYTHRAVDEGVEKPERFSAELLVALAESDYERVEGIASELTAKGATSEKIYFPLGLAQRALGKTAAGSENLRRAQELSGGQPTYATALGDAYDDDGDARNARLFWEKARKANGRYVKGAARDLWGRLLRGERIETVALELERLRNSTPVAPRARAALQLALAELAHRTGARSEALAAIDEAIQLRGQSPRLLAARGRYRLMTGKVKEGLSDFEAAYEITPGNVGYLYRWVDALLVTGKEEQAVAAINSKQKDLEEDARYRLIRSEALLLAGKLGAAQKIYNGILTNQKENADALYGLGQVERRKKNYERARALFERAINARDRFPEALEAVGTMFADMGAPEDGHKQLLEAEKLYVARGEDPLHLRRFYREAVKTLGSSSFGSAWSKKLEDQFGD